jgi:hypothetical protein
MRLLLLPLSLAFIRGTNAINFPFETIQLNDNDIVNFPEISFADKSGNGSLSNEDCKAFPGTKQWPLDDMWTKLNASLSGSLLQPVIPASACYEGPQKDADKCNYLLTKASSSRFYLDDPITILTEWPGGDTCPTLAKPTGNCTRGGFASYVVDVASVKHVQIAVNFARNQNVRLVVK